MIIYCLDGQKIVKNEKYLKYASLDLSSFCSLTFLHFMVIYPNCGSKILWHILLFPNTGNLCLSPPFPRVPRSLSILLIFSKDFFSYCSFIFMLIDFYFVLTFFVFPWLPKMEADYLVKEFIS